MAFKSGEIMHVLPWPKKIETATHAKLQTRACLRDHAPVPQRACTCLISFVQGSRCIEYTLVLQSQTRGGKKKETNTDDGSSDLSVLTVSRPVTGITRHLKESAERRSKVCLGIARRFTILAKARDANHTSFLKAIFIARQSLVLCSQKESVHCLALFLCR